MHKETIEKKDCNYCLDRAKLMFSQYKRNAEEEGKYTTLVFSLGYVTMMTIYSSSAPQYSYRNGKYNNKKQR